MSDVCGVATSLCANVFTGKGMGVAFFSFTTPNITTVDTRPQPDAIPHHDEGDGVDMHGDIPPYAEIIDMQGGGIYEVP